MERIPAGIQLSLHVTERISVSLNPPPPLERARWLSDLGYGLLQALMASNAFGLHS